jgi:tetratricopeptide (TPR) repeat protein
VRLPGGIVVVDVVGEWTGREADALRQALRMTNESFAAYLGVAVRTVAAWRKRPDIVPQPAMQETLDAALERAPERAKAQFALLLENDNRYRLPTGNRNGLTSDDKDRLNGVIRRPSRLDAATIESLSQVLASQRRAEDALGPDAILGPMTLQLETLRKVLRDASGPHREALTRLVAEWTSFVGWLHTAVRKDSKALALFAEAEGLADDVGDGSVAATAASFRGYIARLQGRPRSAIRASAAALATKGADATQHTYDLLQTAQAYADLGDKKEAERFLAKASDLATAVREPPPSVYWYTEPFFRLNIGLAQLGIGQYRDAADSLRSGIEDIPADQVDAEWMNEYHEALAYADERS